MQYQEFINRIRSQSGLEADDQTLTAIRATLETLADHLAGNAPAKLAAQLPEEIGEFITDYKNDENAEGEGFGVEEFINRVQSKTNANATETTEQLVKAVLTVLREAISEGEFDKMRGTLLPEYDELFGAGTFERSNVGQQKA